MLPIEGLADVKLVRTRVSILYDSTYNIILSILIEDLSANMLDVPCSISEQSYIDGKEAKMHTFEEGELTPEQINKLEHDPTIYVFRDGKFLTRPTISISPSDESQIRRVMKDGTPLFSIHENVNLIVKYHDPDNIGFNKTFTQLKMKDRAGFTDPPALFELDPDSLTFEFSLKSEFPGISILRAKDTKYLCGFVPLQMRFVP